MQYYLLVFVAVVMFGVQFLFNGIYEKEGGSSMYSVMLFSFVTSIVGTAVLFLTGGFDITFTPFTVILSLASAVNYILFSLCAIRALGVINLSLFSVFSMIGGMLLPFVTGIVFYDEGINIAKVLCLVIITAAMLCTVQKGAKSKKRIYYAGVFIFNGLSGVLSMIYSNSQLPKASEAGYSMLVSIFRVLLSGIFLLYFIIAKKERPKIKLNAKTGFSFLICGVFGNVANFLLLIALAHIPGSMQYPLVTGGVMVVSTVIGFFTAQKPGRKDVVAVILSLIGMLALLLPV